MQDPCQIGSESVVSSKLVPETDQESFSIFFLLLKICLLKAKFSIFQNHNRKGISKNIFFQEFNFYYLHKLFSEIETQR